MTSELRSVPFPNAGSGPNPVSLADLAAETQFLVLLLRQSHRSGTCRQQGRDVASRYDEFRRLDAQVVAVVPGSRPQLRAWRSLVEPPFPVLADDDAFETEFAQPRQYGLLGRLVGSFGRMPVTVVLDCRENEPSVCYRYEGVTSLDRPPVRDLLEAVRTAQREGYSRR